jgi:orotate phosphoribosyltransferase
MNNYDSPNFFQDFVDAKAILKGHFKLSSGLHSDTYIQCARVLMNPVISNKFCQIIAKKIKLSTGLWAQP